MANSLYLILDQNNITPVTDDKGCGYLSYFFPQKSISQQRTIHVRSYRKCALVKANINTVWCAVVA